jgi:gamma-D-glutamyl-L-lysine dipeptidyl-peptidase
MACVALVTSFGGSLSATSPSTQSRSPGPVATSGPTSVATSVPRPVAKIAPRPVAKIAPRPVAKIAPRPVATIALRPVATSVPRSVATTVKISSSAVAPRAVPVPSPLTVGRAAWVAVSVATLWRAPTSARALDRPALANPAGIRQWLSGMTLTQRRALNGRADTQVLLGDRVVVIARSGSWVKVVAPEQPTPLDARGYPGWVPAAQLTALSPKVSGSVATVVARTTYLRTDNASATPVTEISFGTRLPQVGVSGAWVRVATPTGQVRRLSATAVAVRAPGAAALPSTGIDVVRTAQSFAGLPYLWAGRSGFGFDCSGLTSLNLRAHGVVIPRDADAQSVKGAVAPKAALAPGDLLFYATRGNVHHVSIYAGNGLMVQSPNTGSTVQTIPVSTPAYAREFAGARRPIP